MGSGCRGGQQTCCDLLRANREHAARHPTVCADGKATPAQDTGGHALLTPFNRTLRGGSVQLEHAHPLTIQIRTLSSFNTPCTGPAPRRAAEDNGSDNTCTVTEKGPIPAVYVPAVARRACCTASPPPHISRCSLPEDWLRVDCWAYEHNLFHSTGLEPNHICLRALDSHSRNGPEIDPGTVVRLLF
ncbi:hypothetical protein SKAU_G00128030 [Synaphobranchus kaupii]|uniref:Uncharacterized protein n=1 Tax=Synaphobranchus kaupii TaxID=118154 RepID=A0A9Q1FQT9_SYNKA|nr:hypothetical protein SKAU_G00128030 [Synaphobranchus kaupii]